MDSSSKMYCSTLLQPGPPKVFGQPGPPQPRVQRALQHVLVAHQWRPFHLVADGGRQLLAHEGAHLCAEGVFGIGEVEVHGPTEEKACIAELEFAKPARWASFDHAVISCQGQNSDK
jgi:hypothetical protein